MAQGKYTIVKVDCGYRIEYENETYYIGEQTDNGYCYKDHQAFEFMNGRVCYIAEAEFFDEVGWDENIPDEIADICKQENISICGIGMYDKYNQCGYTASDLLQAVSNWVGDYPKGCLNDNMYDEFIDHIAECALQEVDWCCIETWLYNLDVDEEFEYFLEDRYPELTNNQTKGE